MKTANEIPASMIRIPPRIPVTRACPWAESDA